MSSQYVLGKRTRKGFKKTNLSKSKTVVMNINPRQSFSSYNKSITGFAPRTFTTLKYCDYQTATSVVTVNNEYIYLLNSIFDPDYTGAGHQPMGRDTYALIYLRYRVWKCKWKVIFTPTQSTTMCAVVPNNSVATLPATLSGVLEQPRCQWSMAETNSAGPVTINGSIYLPTLNGQTAAEYKGDDRFQAQQTASPAEQLALHVMMNSETSSGTLQNFTIELTFYVEFFDPITQAQS